MLDYMRKIVKSNPALNVEARNLLSVAYKNSVGTRRTAWRALSSIEQKEESKGSKYLKLIKDNKSKIEKELTDFCNDILALLDEFLIVKAENQEAKVFFLKMKGDYFRYIAEYAQSDQHQKAADGALDAYKKASEIAV